jgi:hypothetical protein
MKAPEELLQGGVAHGPKDGNHASRAPFGLFAWPGFFEDTKRRFGDEKEWSNIWAEIERGSPTLPPVFRSEIVSG